MSFWLAAFETDILTAVLINIPIFRYMIDVSWNLAASIFRFVTEEGLLLKNEGEISPETLLFMCRLASYKTRLDFFFCVVLCR